MARKLIVEVVGDSRSYERALNRSATATNQFGQAMGTTSPRLGKLSAGMAAAGTSSIFLAGAAGGLAVALGTKSVQAASALTEEIAKSQQIFESSADEIRKWSETTAESIGISQVQALQATGTFGGLFSTLGVGAAENAKLSRSLVELAADMASFNNANPEDVLIALRSGLAGEAEPLRRFAVFLSEARVQQVALNQTGKDSVKQLTNQEKALARYSIIMKDTVKQQGDVERTSESLANQQRKLAAQVADLEAALGRVLIPTVTAVVGALNEAISVGEDLASVLKTLAGLPGIEIPVKLVGQVTAGRGGSILRHIVLGGISPLALGITIGKEIADGIRSGAAGALTTIGPRPEEGVAGAELAATAAAKATAREAAKGGQAVIDSITKQVAAQSDLNVQLANSEKRAAHLRDLIRADPDNAKLQRRLTAELEKQSSLRGQIAAQSRATADANRASAEAAREEAKAAAEVRKERERAAAARAREKVKEDQFKALGLTAEGLKPTPGAESLLRRTLGFEQRIKGTKLGAKLGTQIDQIKAVLMGKFGKAKQEVRAAILDMLNAWSDALEGKGATTGPLTKTHGLSTDKILAGLGLSPEQQRELRGRLAHATTNVGGAITRAAGQSGATISPGGFGNMPPFVVDSYVTINIDGRKVTSVVTRGQQKARRSNPAQKRGPNRAGQGGR